jgi:hypothetical protein
MTASTHNEMAFFLGMKKQYRARPVMMQKLLKNMCFFFKFFTNIISDQYKKTVVHLQYITSNNKFLVLGAFRTLLFYSYQTFLNLTALSEGGVGVESNSHTKVTRCHRSNTVPEN